MTRAALVSQRPRSRLHAVVRRLAMRSLGVLLVLVGPVVDALALDGVIIDVHSGKPVAYAEVSILGKAGVVVTDAEGRFSWMPQPVPPFEVLVVTPGGRYLRPILVEKVPEGAPLVIHVEPLVSEEVTVTGAAPGIESTPASGTTTVTRKEMEARQPRTLVQALENVAGVSSVSEGHAAVPALRGLARGRTLILVDGARVSSERRVGPSATFLDPLSLEGVEVARGPGSVAYGSDAFGGVILARTRRPDPNSPLRFRLGGALGAGVPEARGSVEVSKGTASGGVLAQVHARDYEDYRSPDGEVFNSGSSDAGFLFRAEGALGRGLLSAGWQSDFGRDIGRPRNNSRAVRFYYPIEDSHRLTADYDLRQVAGFSRVAFSGFFGRSRLVTDQDRPATASAPRSIERADVSASDFQVRGLAERFVGSARVEAGLDVNGRYGLEALDIAIVERPGRTDERTNVSIEDAHRLDAGAYLTVEAPLGAVLTAAAGARGDSVTSRNEGGHFGDRSTSDGAFSGFASATAGPFGGISVTGQVARGFRDPLLSDRYYSGPTGRGFITGNPDLTAETSLQLDLAVRFTGTRYRYAVYGYHYRITDLVERYESSPDFFFFRNRGEARIHGIEVEASAALNRHTTVQVAGQISRGDALDDDSPLDDMPADSISIVLRREIGRRTFVQVRGAAYARDERPGPTERVMPGYATVDAAGGYQVSDRLQLWLAARNLLDQPYLASVDPRAVLAPGISVSLSVVATF